MLARLSLPRITAVVLALGMLGSCKKQTPAAGKLPYTDSFDRDQLGPDWFPSGGDWKVRDGYVYTTFSNNMPLFLNVDLPDEVVVEVDVYSETREVDSKIELMTDGRTHQSGYVFIMGGWSNKMSVIARLDEHGDDRVVKQPTGVTGGKWYRWRVEKRAAKRGQYDGHKLTWLVDGKHYMEFFDAAPLHGSGHNRLGFGNWQNQIRFDNVKIWAAKDAPAVVTSTSSTPSTGGRSP